MAASLRAGGRLVLSIGLESNDWLDYGCRQVPLFPAPPEAYIGWLKELGCEVTAQVELVDRFVYPSGKKSETYGRPTASLIAGETK